MLENTIPQLIFKQTINIKAMARTLLVSKSTIWFIHIKHKCTSQRSKTKRLQRPQKTTEVYDDRIASGAESLVFIDDVTSDTSTRMNCEV